MGKKYFIFKLINLMLIFGLLFAYQYIAEDRAEKEAAAMEKARQQTTQTKTAGSVSAYKDGTYEGSAEGYGGQIVMKITIKDGVIKNAEAVSASGEDASYWNMARKIIPEIVQNQDPDVDTVSGATYSSTGIINASTKALQQAVR